MAITLTSTSATAGSCWISSEVDTDTGTQICKLACTIYLNTVLDFPPTAVKVKLKSQSVFLVYVRTNSVLIEGSIHVFDV